MKVSQGSLAAAQELADTFGLAPLVKTYTKIGSAQGINIAMFADCPAPGLNSLGTVSLSDHDLGLQLGVRLEIVAVYPAGSDQFPHAVAHCAIMAAADGEPMQRGAVYPDAIKSYLADATMEHLFFVMPFVWGDGPHKIEHDGLSTLWLQAVPISEAERLYAEAQGAMALENLLAEREVNVADLNRASVVAG